MHEVDPQSSRSTYPIHLSTPNNERQRSAQTLLQDSNQGEIDRQTPDDIVITFDDQLETADDG